MPEVSSTRGGGAALLAAARTLPDPTLVRAARAFAERHDDALAHDRKGALPKAILEEARALSLFGMSIPESFGGLGLDLTTVGAVVAELARVDRAVATTVGLHNGLGTRAIIEAGSPDLQARYLPEMASGKRIGAFAATEPSSGSDLSGVRTRLTRCDDVLRLSGEKAYVTNAGVAGVFTVLARAPQDEGAHATTLIVVPRESVGLSLGAEERKMGLRASSTRALFFDEVPVTAEHRLGGGARGALETHRALEWGRTLMAAGCLGTARAALERSLAHTAERRQFKKALRSFGVVRGHLSEIAVAVAAIEATLFRVTRDAALGRSIEASSAALKVLASELSCDAADRAVQLHGALGFVEDAGVALLLRDARVTRIFEGANDVLLVRLGSALLAGRGLPVTEHVDEPSILTARARLGATLRTTRASLGVTVVGHQLLVVALARTDLWLYAAEACLLDVARRPEHAQIFAEASRRLTDRAFETLERIGVALADEQADSTILECLEQSGETLVRP